MLHFGQDLYRLTLRDEETLLVEPWFKTKSQTIGAGSIQAQVDWAADMPVDRSLYLHQVNIEGFPGAAQTWAQVQLYLSDRQAGVQVHQLACLRGTLAGDGNVAATAGQSVCFQFPVRMVLPPNVTLNINMAKSVNTNAGTFVAWAYGYLIPPGRIGRGV